MVFTALHRALGEQPGPITEALIDAAIKAGVAEADDLDWKRQLPPISKLKESDFAKDVAALANTNGGVIVYGVVEKGKRATGYAGGVELSEQYERAISQALYFNVEPPVFGVETFALGVGERQVVVLVVPASLDAPHLVSKDPWFAAPRRYDAETIWMRERQLEMAYRARFDEKRNVMASLETLYSEADRSHPQSQRCWFVGVARPRTPQPRNRLDAAEARGILAKARELGRAFARHNDKHPLTIVNIDELRPGLRRWVAPGPDDSLFAYRETWVSVHHDGSVSIAASVGDKAAPRTSVEAARIECGVADLLAIARETGQARATADYDVRVGMSWADGDTLLLRPRAGKGRAQDNSSVPIYRFIPISMSVDVSAPLDEFFEHGRQLAEDCINQGGIHELAAFRKKLTG